MACVFTKGNAKYLLNNKFELTLRQSFHSQDRKKISNFHEKYFHNGVYKNGDIGGFKRATEIDESILGLKNRSEWVTTIAKNTDRYCAEEQRLWIMKYGLWFIVKENNTSDKIEDQKFISFDNKHKRIVTFPYKNIFIKVHGYEAPSTNGLYRYKCEKQNCKVIRVETFLDKESAYRALINITMQYPSSKMKLKIYNGFSHPNLDFSQTYDARFVKFLDIMKPCNELFDTFNKNNLCSTGLHLLEALQLYASHNSDEKKYYRWFYNSFNPNVFEDHSIVINSCYSYDKKFDGLANYFDDLNKNTTKYFDDFIDGNSEYFLNAALYYSYPNFRKFSLLYKNCESNENVYEYDENQYFLIRRTPEKNKDKYRFLLEPQIIEMNKNFFLENDLIDFMSKF